MEKAIGELQYQFYQKSSNRNLVVDDAKKIVQKMHVMSGELISKLDGAQPEDVNEANDKKSSGGGQQRITIFGKQQVKEIFANAPFKKDGKLIFQTYNSDFDESDFYSITGGHGNAFYIEWNKKIYEGLLASSSSKTYFQIITKEEAMPNNFNPRTIFKKDLKLQDKIV